MADDTPSRLRRILTITLHAAYGGAVQIAIGAAFGLAIAVAVLPLTRNVPGETKTVLMPFEVTASTGPGADGDVPGPMGWNDDPAAVKEVIATLPFKSFAVTPAGQSDDAPPQSAYLWEASKKAIKKYIPTRNQLSVGSCVSFGSACGVEYVECVQIAGGSHEEFKDIAQEVIYGGSRVQIGGGTIRGDGSVGAWAAQWCKQYGVVSRGKYDGFDLSEYSESTCRKFGDVGCPASLVPIARQRPVKEITPVKTTESLKKALASGYPVTVASNVGFGNRGPYVRNAKGQLRASGSWAHQMCFIGYDADSGFCVMNSWGETWVSGPTGPGNPPPGSFYVDDATAGRMLAANDSWAYSALSGFPLRKLDWFIKHEVRPRLDFARADLFTLAV